MRQTLTNQVELIMIDIFSGVNKILSGLGGIQSNTALKAHVALFKDELDIIRKRYVELEDKNAKIVERNNELEVQLARQAKKEEFVEAGGALFKSLGNGKGYSLTPYCPDCHSAMRSPELFLGHIQYYWTELP